MNESLKNLVYEYFNSDISDVHMEYQEEGLTNQNYIISKNDLKYVIRICGGNTFSLGINREAELAAMRAASTIGVAAEIVYYSTDTGNMITKFIEGKKFTNSDASIKENIVRIADTMKKVHQLPKINYEFNPYMDIENRIKIAASEGLELPDYSDCILDKLYKIMQDRRRYRDECYGLCHNDPFPNNFIDDGTINLLDWEFAGMGDIYFDLASIGMFYSPLEKKLLLRHYFGEALEKEQKSLEQMSYVVSFWNATWAVIQSKNANNKFDYKGMANHIFMNLKTKL